MTKKDSSSRGTRIPFDASHHQVLATRPPSPPTPLTSLSLFSKTCNITSPSNSNSKSFIFIRQKRKKKIRQQVASVVKANMVESNMGTETPAPIIDKGAPDVETPLDGSHQGKKNQKKVPKRIHKAEREKMKREHLNELFLSLADALELSEQNQQTNGKASILGEAARFVKDMLSQIKHLRTENTTLLSESQYLSVEKKELQDEKSALEAEVFKLQSEVKAREAESNLDLNLAPPESQQQEFASRNNFMPASEHAFHQSRIMNPVYVLPLNSNPQSYPAPDAAMAMPTSTLKKPQARYPTPADVWPSQIFEKRPRLL